MIYENSLHIDNAAVTPESDEVIEIVRKKKYNEPLPPYNIVGNGLTNRHGTSVDILEICLQLNMAEMKLLQFLRTAFTVNSINKEEIPNVVLPSSWEEFDKYLSTALMKNYTHLEYLQVVKRIRRGVYMVNPRILMPSKEYLRIEAMWDNL